MIKFFNKEIECDKCETVFIAVGNEENLPMTTGSENVLATDITVGKILTTEGAKSDIHFKAKCPECSNIKETFVLQ